MIESFECTEFIRHGAARWFSADHKFCKPVLQAFINKYVVTVLARPSHSPYNFGRIERNNGILKSIILKLHNANGKDSTTCILFRTSFIANCLRGSRKISAFQLLNGYNPSILGIPISTVHLDILKTYVKKEVAREIERVIKGSITNRLYPGVLPPGTDVLVFYNSTNQNKAT